MTDLLNVDDALQIILSRIEQVSSEDIELESALNRVLAQDISAPTNLPPFANSSMDGYAVRSEDIQQATRETPRRLAVVMDIPAGKTPEKAIDTGQAARIMTGAPLPDGADAVIPVEDTDANWRTWINETTAQQVAIYRTVESGAYVRAIGEDIRQGVQVLKNGTLLRPQEIGMLAALGFPRVKVVRQPLVAILTTGDELVNVDQPLTPGKIRDVNTYTLTGLVHANGGVVYPLPIARDSLEEVRNLFKSALQPKPDMLISSAGVSVGAADLIRTVLEELGEVGFWRINLRPGKPLAFGHIQDVPFFGLPGNPVSAMVTFEVLVRPALLKMAGRVAKDRIIQAVCDEDIKSDGRRSYIRVNLVEKDGVYHATTTGTQSSGALMSMVIADGLMIVPEDVQSVKAGTTLDVRLLK
ncbi:MAG: molybdopterin molybdotransferase MoeA [Aggregatilineales bacterium]